MGELPPAEVPGGTVRGAPRSGTARLDKGGPAAPAPPAEERRLWPSCPAASSRTVSDGPSRIASSRKRVPSSGKALPSARFCRHSLSSALSPSGSARVAGPYGNGAAAIIRGPAAPQAGLPVPSLPQADSAAVARPSVGS